MATFLVLVRPAAGHIPQPQVQGRKQKIKQAYGNAKGWAQQSNATSIFAVTQNTDGIVGAAIVEANNAQQVMQEAQTFPLGADMSYEVLSLTDFNQWMDHSAQQVDNV